MKELKEKFIVIPIKRLKEFEDNTSVCNCRSVGECFHDWIRFDWFTPEVKGLIKAYKSFIKAYKKRTGKDYPDNNYYVCNQDEPYAQKVIDIILEGETKKELESKQ